MSMKMTSSGKYPSDANEYLFCEHIPSIKMTSLLKCPSDVKEYLFCEHIPSIKLTSSGPLQRREGIPLL
jgi:hypothetical protein